VSVDDLILDMSAKELDKMRFCGHVYRADFEKVKEERGYDKKVRAKLTPTSKTALNDADRARDIANGNTVDDDELKPMLWMMDVWVPENKSVATFAMPGEDGAGLSPLIERDWTGGQAGPYKFLSLGMVPDNIIPSSPASNLKGLHDLQNRMYRRMEADSDAHKKVNVYEPGSSDDADRLRKAKRNDWLKVKNPKSIQQLEMGGIDAREQAFAIFIQEGYDRQAGNLRAMGGLGAQAATVGQEEIVQGNVSRMEADMQFAVVKFAADCCYELGHLMWKDQQMTINSSMQIGNTSIEVDSSWRPEERVGEFDDYGLRVEPYSMVYKTPRQKLAELFETLNNLGPLWPMFQASGASLDAEAIMDEIARLLDRPELKRFITFASPAAQLGGDQNTIRSPAVTTRNTVRRNVPTGGTAESRSALLQQVLSGASGPQVNSQQMASMGRQPA